MIEDMTVRKFTLKTQNDYIRVVKNFTDRYAVQRLRLDVVDIIDRRKRDTLEATGNPAAHLVRWHAAVGPDDAHDRDADVRKDVLRRIDDHEGPQDEDQQ